MSDEIKNAVSPFKRDGWAGPFAWEPPTMRHRYFQDGVEKDGKDVDMSREYRVEDYHVKAEKKTYWIERVQGMYPGFEVVGNGPYVFVSQCSKKAYLFSERKPALDQRCEAGANCRLFGCHSRHLLKWIPPIKCGQWED